MLARRRHTFQQGVSEIPDRPCADAVLGILRNIGRNKGAEWRLEFKPAYELKACVALRPGLGMAGGAAAGIEDTLAPGNIAWAELRQGRRIKRDRCRQQPPRRRAGDAQDEGRDDEFLQPCHGWRSAL